ncbi:hypothetical protein [Ensifer sesbaniae]|uniref:hypothetical protein n=1 Tax=Ensifer sesbaniae TaxID=1214071 RepID=UPI001FEA1F39|nr:hypothetical protein [Ensifer sesbaniae]NRQ13444.1 hypothetical protein [Ensifer sesbaniae]
MARAYRVQITAGLLNNLAKLGIAAIDQHEPILKFWQAVRDEIAKNLEGAA